MYNLSSQAAVKTGGNYDYYHKQGVELTALCNDNSHPHATYIMICNYLILSYDHMYCIVCDMEPRWPTARRLQLLSQTKGPPWYSIE